MKKKIKKKSKKEESINSLVVFDVIFLIGCMVYGSVVFNITDSINNTFDALCTLGVLTAVGVILISLMILVKLFAYEYELLEYGSTI